MAGSKPGFARCTKLLPAVCVAALLAVGTALPALANAGTAPHPLVTTSPTASATVDSPPTTGSPEPEASSSADPEASSSADPTTSSAVTVSPSISAGASTPTDQGAVSRLLQVAAVTTTSGTLRAAQTGAPLRNSCVAWVSASAPAPAPVSWRNVNFDGTWSFESEDAGPFYLAFYVTSNGDCSSAILAAPVPSWFTNQPLAQTIPQELVPPAGAEQVPAGRADVTACLGAQNLPSTCTAPNAVMSGDVVKPGPLPVAQACVFLLGPDGAFAQAITDTAGRWQITDVPVDYPMVVGVVPPFNGPNGPCSSDGPPPVPGPGELQPEMYVNTWVDLGDQNLLNGPFQWGLVHGASPVANSRAGIEVCLTTDPGTVVPRPGCDATPSPSTMTPASATGKTTAALQAAGGNALPDTGAPVAWEMLGALVFVAIGLLLLLILGRRRA
ncbi:MAG: hypothetical protein WCG47_04000 [Dermatophilaceae bacterium]